MSRVRAVRSFGVMFPPDEVLSYDSSAADKASYITGDAVPIKTGEATPLGSLQASSPVSGSDVRTDNGSDVRMDTGSTGHSQVGTLAFGSDKRPMPEQRASVLIRGVPSKKMSGSTSHPLERAVMFIVVASACSTSILQAWYCFQRFQSEPVILKRSMRHIPLVPIPALTLCNSAIDIGMTKGYKASLSDLPWEDAGNLTMTNFLRDAFPPFQRYLTCELLNQSCDRLGSWHNRYTSGLGICTTFRPFNNLTITEVGTGYKLAYYHNRGYYSDNNFLVLVDGKFINYSSDDRRLYVFLHEGREPFTPLPWVRQRTPLQVRPGTEVSARIDTTAQKLKNRRVSACLGTDASVDDNEYREGDEGDDRGDDGDDGSDDDDVTDDIRGNGDGYRQILCLERCLSDATLDSANTSCRTIDMLSPAPICDTAEEYLRLLRLYSEVSAPAASVQTACHTRCPPACVTVQYQPEVVPYRPSFGPSLGGSTRTRVRLTYDSLQVGVEEENWEYTASAMLGEIGGFAGIMLGVSVVSLMQVLRDVLGRSADCLGC